MLKGTEIDLLKGALHRLEKMWTISPPSDALDAKIAYLRAELRERDIDPDGGWTIPDWARGTVQVRR